MRKIIVYRVVEKTEILIANDDLIIEEMLNLAITATTSLGALGALGSLDWTPVTKPFVAVLETNVFQ